LRILDIIEAKILVSFKTISLSFETTGSPLAIVVSCHGQKGSGNFSDWNGGNKRFSWTPERLWNGYENFKGLKSLLKERENIKAYVVLAQCYGGIFGEKLKEIVTRERYEHTEVIGLSKETTQRVVSKKGSKVATTCYHKQLAHWLNTFSAIKLPEGSEEDLDIDTESGD
jgi:hypothetical protein